MPRPISQKRRPSLTRLFETTHATLWSSLRGYSVIQDWNDDIGLRPVVHFNCEYCLSRMCAVLHNMLTDLINRDCSFIFLAEALKLQSLSLRATVGNLEPSCG